MKKKTKQKLKQSAVEALLVTLSLALFCVVMAMIINNILTFLGANETYMIKINVYILIIVSLSVLFVIFGADYLDKTLDEG